MSQGFGRRDVTKLVATAPEKGTAARRDHQSSHFAVRTPAQALRQCGVFGVNSNDLARTRHVKHQFAADDERLLVGQCQHASGVQRRERGAQAGRAVYPVDNDVARPRGNFHRRVRPDDQFRTDPGCAKRVTDRISRGWVGDSHRLNTELRCLFRQQLRPPAPRGDRRNPELVGVARNDIDRLRPDRSG